MSAKKPPKPLKDLNVVVAGQGGDGSLTVISLLAGVLQQGGMKAYTERDVLSRIKGGITSATLRAFHGERYCIGSRIDVMMAFDPDAIEKRRAQLDSDSVLIYDNSAGELASDIVPAGVVTYGASFARHAVRMFRRDIFKNSIGFAFLARVLGLPDEVLKQSFERRFSRAGAQILKYNLQALEVGFDLAEQAGLDADNGLYELEHAERQAQMLITGNEATALGFLVSGGRFFAGYPITPSTDIMEWLSKWLPKFGGVVRQAEDELSAINMAIGSALTGTRTMIATSGPGLSLMQEGIGQAGMAEIPLVIADAQRGGPSTGLPTKPEQSDLNLILFGGHGDFPRVVLAPGTPEQCFYVAVQATNLAQKYQCPVFIVLDQGLGQNSATIDTVDLDQVVVDQGKRLNSDELAGKPEYKRYAFSEDGISPLTVPGMANGMWLVTGNEHDEFGHVNTHPINRQRMMDKRQQKLVTMQAELPRAYRRGDAQAEIGIIGIGMAYGAITEALEELAARGINMQFFQPQTLMPLLPETSAFVDARKYTYVVDYNAGAQLYGYLLHEGVERAKLRSILKYDALPITPADIVRAVVEREKSDPHSVQVQVA